MEAVGLLLSLGWALIGGAMAAPVDKEPAKSPNALELKGLLVPYEIATLSSRSTGVIKSIKEEGSPIRKDEVVLALEDDVEKSSVDLQKAVLEKRKWEVESNKKLRGKGGSSEDEELTIKANYETALAQVRQAEAILDKKLVRSPFDGVVVRRIRQPGEAVDQYLPVLQVVNISKVYLETFLPVTRLKDVQQGQEVQVRVPDLPGRAFAGRIEFIAPVIDPASGEFRIKILLSNDDRVVRSGMSAVGALDIPDPEMRANPPTAKP